MRVRRVLPEALPYNSMNKKTTNLFLGIAVVAIWGGAGYRLISGLGDAEEPLPVTAPVVKRAPEDFAPAVDTARLRLNYHDPFGLAAIPVQKDTTHRQNGGRKAFIKPVTPDMSFIKYAGYISNPGAKRTVVMLQINGKTLMLNVGESAEGIKLLQNMRDSVKVLYRKQVRFIVKSS
jgi:hypothetical protein